MATSSKSFPPSAAAEHSLSQAGRIARSAEPSCGLTAYAQRTRRAQRTKGNTKNSNVLVLSRRPFGWFEVGPTSSMTQGCPERAPWSRESKGPTALKVLEPGRSRAVCRYAGLTRTRRRRLRKPARTRRELRHCSRDHDRYTWCSVLTRGRKTPSIASGHIPGGCCLPCVLSGLDGPREGKV